MRASGGCADIDDSFGRRPGGRVRRLSRRNEPSPRAVPGQSAARRSCSDDKGPLLADGHSRRHEPSDPGTRQALPGSRSYATPPAAVCPCRSYCSSSAASYLGLATGRARRRCRTEARTATPTGVAALPRWTRNPAPLARALHPLGREPARPRRRGPSHRVPPMLEAQSAACREHERGTQPPVDDISRSRSPRWHRASGAWSQPGSNR